MRSIPHSFSYSSARQAQQQAPVIFSLASESNGQGVRRSLVVDRWVCTVLMLEGFDNVARWAYGDVMLANGCEIYAEVLTYLLLLMILDTFRWIYAVLVGYMEVMRVEVINELGYSEAGCKGKSLGIEKNHSDEIGLGRWSLGRMGRMGLGVRFGVFDCKVVERKDVVIMKYGDLQIVRKATSLQIGVMALRKFKVEK
ncbi:hypothetical protein FB567DRAFT_63198 [Paraphoma chrysanthemicola]|uniref:Uncharacterized protein n=1 Tax=Paraphoma chrysanthemicola TaxID=798071 RepID=A0A8K0R4G3_9PLEO|nr:hypothetical protein FB567DRAFT_63198 [Paraphoma chrysanthemicola]